MKHEPEPVTVYMVCFQCPGCDKWHVVTRHFQFPPGPKQSGTVPETWPDGSYPPTIRRFLHSLYACVWTDETYSMEEEPERTYLKLRWGEPKRRGEGAITPSFLDREQQAYIRSLLAEGDLDQAEGLLLGAEPSPAVLDGLRKIASARARRAKKAGDWQAVLEHLEGYTAYAEECREHCMITVNQALPSHTKRDRTLLEKAKAKLACGGL
jgi:hypothetical protein